MSNGPRHQQVGLASHALGSVVQSEEGGTVNDDALDGHEEATVQTNETICLKDFGQAIAQTGELSGTSTFADISGKPANEKKRYCTIMTKIPILQ